MEIVLLILAIICLVLGLVGSVLPGLPGPPLSYTGLWLIQWSDVVRFSTVFLVITGLVMLIISVIDYFLPPLITRTTGGSKYATTGSIMGMIVGIFLTPVGMILGMILGTFIGEFIFAKQKAGNAFKTAMGALGGFILGTGMKLLYCFFVMVAPLFYL
jgi:uncharacterized protein YqgC (DUF456 family)